MANQIIQLPVPLVFKKILKDKVQGELTIRNDQFTKTLFFQQGNLIFAQTDVIGERLGEVLFKIGKIDRPQFGDVMKLIETKDEHEKIGKLLVKENILNQRDLFFALLYQFRTIATSVFGMTNGEWDFVSCEPDVPEDSRFNIELAGVISEGINKINNFSYFKNKFYYMSPGVRPIPENLAEFLSTYEINFFKELGALAGNSNDAIRTKLKMSEDGFWKKLILFHLLGIVDFQEIAAEADVDKNVEDIIGLYDHLKAGKMDYYQLLKLEKDASFAQIKEAYFSLAKKYHPDRVVHAPDPDIKDKANFVFAEMNKAYDVLSDNDKKREYDTRGYKESSMEDTVQENLAEKARMLYRKGKTLYTQKKYWEAASVLDEAVGLDNRKASYFLLLGMAQMNLPPQKRMAEKNLYKATELDHYSVDAFSALGMLYLSENQVNRSEGFFRKALSINPDHALSRKKLDEIGAIKNPKKKGFSLFGKKK